MGWLQSEENSSLITSVQLLETNGAKTAIGGGSWKLKSHNGGKIPKETTAVSAQHQGRLFCTHVIEDVDC
jgi:hypothetical protein